MGKSFHNHQLISGSCLGFAGLLLVFLLLFRVADTSAVQGEFELFDRGLEYYLSYQPDRAVEAFETFLRNFPRSSAKDAAMFWLGKSLVQVKSPDEAGRVLAQLKEEFPESPLVPFVARELDILGREDPPGRSFTGPAEAGGKLLGQEREETQAEAERERCRIRLMDEKKGLLREGGKDKDREALKNGGVSSVRIGGRNYSAGEIMVSMMVSSAAMARSGIKEVPWRSGNLYEDFINEQLLYDEAQRINVSADPGREEAVDGRSGLSGEETEYLRKYRLISGLIDWKLRTAAEQRVVESLTVQYGDNDKRGKMDLAVKLQALARTGKSFEELGALFRGRVRFQVIRFGELQGWIRERVEPLRDGEPGIVWTRDGYMLLRPVKAKPFLGPSEEKGAGEKSGRRDFLATWIGELRAEATDIGIVYAE